MKRGCNLLTCSIHDLAYRINHLSNKTSNAPPRKISPCGYGRRRRRSLLRRSAAPAHGEGAIWITPHCKPRDVTRLKHWLKRQSAVCPEPFSYAGSVCWNTTDSSFAGTKMENYKVQAAGTSFSVLYQRGKTKDKDLGHLRRMSVCVKWVRQFCFVRKRSRSLN